MFFRQVLYRDLGCASYVVGDADEAVVVDPRWDIDEYLRIAAAERLSIAHVVDTHEHADHVSGRERLVAATGARSHRPTAPASESAPGDRDSGIIAAGDTIDVGSVRLTALGTPGHRPEHLSFAVADLSRGPEPWMLLTGDSLLVGDVARPDLAYEPAEGAAALHATLAELLALGDWVELWPAHVGGSLCGGAGLSHKPSSTIGYERRHNPLLALGEPEFVRGVTASLALPAAEHRARGLAQPPRLRARPRRARAADQRGAALAARRRRHRPRQSFAGRLRRRAPRGRGQPPRRLPGGWDARRLGAGARPPADRRRP